MKKLLALLLLFGIVGCKSGVIFTDNFVAEVSDDIRVLAMSYPEEYSLQDIETLKSTSNWDYEYLNSRVVKNTNDFTKGEARKWAEAINIKTGKKFHIGNIPTGLVFNPYKYSATELARLNCEHLYKSECIVSIDGHVGTWTKVIYEDLSDYESQKLYASQAEQRAEATRIQLKKQNESKRLAVIHALKERCISYGFTGNNNIAACVQREAKHDYEIEQQKYQVELLRQQLATQNNQTIVSEDIPWWLEILGAVAEGAAEGYKQAALINAMDSRYEKKDIYRYCRPNC